MIRLEELIGYTGTEIDKEYLQGLIERALYKYTDEEQAIRYVFHQLKKEVGKNEVEPKSAYLGFLLGTLTKTVIVERRDDPGVV